MDGNEKPYDKIEFIEKGKTNLKELYQELNKAIISNNIQSIWGLSKIITRYHFKEFNE